MEERAQRVPGVYRAVLREGEDMVFRTGVPAFLGFAAAAGPPAVLTRWAQFSSQVRGVPADSLLAPAVRGFFAAGGRRCVVATAAASSGPDGLLGALRGLDDDSDVDLIAAPDLVRPLGPALRAAEPEIAALVAVQVELVRSSCGARRCLTLLDGPPTRAGAEAHALALRAALAAAGPPLLRDAALHFPWVRAPDDTRTTPPSGHVAGTISRLDESDGVHRAPAGVTLDGACDLGDTLDDAAQLRLDALGVNCIRAFRGRGIRLWGARTLSDEPEWRPISVRRLLQTIARWLELRLADFVFETNDALTWNRLAREVGDHCERLYAAGALQGKVPAESYFIKCDAENNPPEVRDAGMLVAEIGVAPLVPQEFIALRLVQRGGGLSLTDAG